MYDKEKGIYPSGSYLVGRDLPLGGYIFKAKKGETGMVSLFKDYEDFKNKKNAIVDQWFEDDIHLSLMEENNYLLVEEATIKRNA